MVICLERDADLHMAQLMPLPLTVSCLSKMQNGFTFLIPAHPGISDKGPLNGCVCVCICIVSYAYILVNFTVCICLFLVVIRSKSKWPMDCCFL